MISGFQKNIDIHKMTAAEVNNVALKDVTPEMRYKAKALNFGMLYGMGARAFAESARISRDEAQLFMEEYFRNFRGIAAFIEEQKEFARTHGYTKTAFGRKRFFPDINNSNFRIQREAERMAVNHPIQGTEADINKKAMIAIDEFIREKKLQEVVHPLLQIHDELLFEIREDSIPSVKPKIQKLMENVWRGKVTMKVETKQGTDWGALE